MLSLETNLNDLIKYSSNLEPYREKLCDVMEVLDFHDLLDPDDLDATIKNQKEQIEALEQEVCHKETQLNMAYDDRDIWEDKYKDLVNYLSNNYDMAMFDETALELMGE